MTKPNYEKKLIEKIEVLEKAVLTLEVAINKPLDTDRMMISGTIQRFEFTFELTWKTLKLVLQQKGIITAFPRDVLQAAYQGSLIDNEQLWLAMMADRNITSHTYDDVADKIYAHIKNAYYPELLKTLLMLKATYC